MTFEHYPFEKLAHLLAGITPNPQKHPISLTIGEPQFQTPLFIQDALKQHSETLRFYPKTLGEDFLRISMMGFVTRRFGITLHPNQLVATFGTREVLFNLPQYLLFDKKTPTMAFPNPFYQIYEGAAIASRAKIIHLDLKPENDFKPDVEEFMENLKKGIVPDIVILNSPNNPTGSVLTLTELCIWAKLALEFDFVLINDECYSEIYHDHPPHSLLEASIRIGNTSFKNILVVNSISKRSSAPGLRSGFIAGDTTLLKGYVQYRTYIGCASPLPLQYAAAVAWDDDIHVQKSREEYRKNGLLAQSILGVKEPEATFYLWLPVENDLEITKKVYEEQNIKLLPGSFLGRDGVGAGFVRLALVYAHDKTEEILHQLSPYFEILPKDSKED